MASTLNPSIIAKTPVGKAIYDDKVVGLHIRVTEKANTFYLYYRTLDGKERRPKIGTYPTLGLVHARDIATRWLREVAAGGDPADKKRRARASATVAALAERYLAEHAATKKTGDQDRRLVKVYVLPRLRTTKVKDVTPANIYDLRHALRKTPIQANRVLALLSKMFSLAELWDMRPVGTNPCGPVARFPEHKRHRYATPDEAKLVWARLLHYAPIYPQQVAFIWLLIYTGARPSEIAAILPEQVHGDVVLLEEHKTAASSGAPRVIHLPPPAVAVIAGLKQPRGGKPLLGIKSPRHLWRKILADTGIEDLHLYDLRHTFASLALDSGVPLDQLGPLMGHKSTATTHRYAHLLTTRARAVSKLTAEALDSHAAGGK